MDKLSWQQNRVTKNFLNNCVDGVIEYAALEDWDFLEEMEMLTGDEETDKFLKEIIAGVTKELPIILEKHIIDKYGLTVVGNKMKLGWQNIENTWYVYQWINARGEDAWRKVKVKAPTAEDALWKYEQIEDPEDKETYELETLADRFDDGGLVYDPMDGETIISIAPSLSVAKERLLEAFHQMEPDEDEDDLDTISSKKKRAWQNIPHSVQDISFNELVRTHQGQEGIVMLGAGGDMNDWIDGLTKMLNEDGIAQGTPEELFSGFYRLNTTGGRTDLVMFFGDTGKFNIGKMAIWRLQFGGDMSWYSDWVDNYAEHYRESSKRAWKKIDEDEGEGKEFVILDGGIKARVGDKVRYVDQGDDDYTDNEMPEKEGTIAEILNDEVVEVDWDNGESYSIHISRLESIGPIRTEAKSPSGRKKQVEKLKEMGMPDEEAFGIAWKQQKEHGKPKKKNKKKKKSSLRLAFHDYDYDASGIPDECPECHSYPLDVDTTDDRQEQIRTQVSCPKCGWYDTIWVNKTGDKEASQRIAWQGLSDNGFKVGDEVVIQPMSSFGDPSTQEIVKIKTMFQPNDGTPYRVIVTDNGQEFRADNGQPIKEPWGYYLVIPGFDKIDSDRAPVSHEEHPFVAGETVLLAREITDANDPTKVFPEGTKVQILRVGDTQAKVAVPMNIGGERAWWWNTVVDFDDLRRIPRNRESSMKTADEIDDIQNIRKRIYERLNMFKDEEYPLEILPFTYNGFMGNTEGNTPIARGKFLEKTNDPGVVKVLLNTGKEQLVPTFAIRGELPGLKWKNIFDEDSDSVAFGPPSSLGSKKAMYDWPYLYLKDGMIVDEQGKQAFQEPTPYFNTVEEAEAWLTENNYRGTVQGDYNMRTEAFKEDIMDPFNEQDFIDWFEENKNSDQLWEEYFTSEERRDGMSFNEWARGKWEALRSTMQASLKNKSYDKKWFKIRSQVMKEKGYTSKDMDNDSVEDEVNRETSKRYKKEFKKEANGIALNVLSILFEDKYPPYKVPAELRLLRSKAKQAIAKIASTLESQGREDTPPDFPMEWYSTNVTFASPNDASVDYQNFVTETRALFEEIINYANRAVGGTDFYSSMKSTIAKVGRNREGVTILRELVDGRPFRYGYINEFNDYIALKDFKEMPKYSTMARVDKGTPVMILGYKDVNVSTDSNLIEGLMKTADEGGLDAPLMHDLGNDDTFWSLLKKKWDKLGQEVNDFGARLQALQDEVAEHIASWEKEDSNTMNDTMSSFINDLIIKEAIDVSDEIPPMGWDATEPGTPAGAGAPKPQADAFKSEDEKEQEKADKGVLYDSSKDKGPQFQTTINPSDKSVTVKFVDSPEQQQFKEKLDAFDSLPKLNTKPATPQPGGQPSAEGVGEQKPGEFSEQEVPVVF